MESFCKSQFLHKSVNMSFIIKSFYEMRLHLPNAGYETIQPMGSVPPPGASLTPIPPPSFSGSFNAGHPPPPRNTSVPPQGATLSTPPSTSPGVHPKL